MAIYGFLAVALVWLGIGSILARRWAQALLLIWSWGWLISGLSMTVAMAFILPHLPATSAAQTARAPTPPAGLVYGVTLGFCFFFGFVLPLIWLLFYRSRNVRLTCAARDPVERWTDRVHCRCSRFRFGWPSMARVFSPFLYALLCVAVFRLLPARCARNGCFVLLGLLWLWTARAVFRLEWIGWWIALFSSFFYPLSSSLTYARHGLLEVYAGMHYSPEMIARLSSLSVVGRAWMIWGPWLFALPLVGYLFFVRRFFRRPVV